MKNSKLHSKHVKWYFIIFFSKYIILLKKSWIKEMSSFCLKVFNEIDKYSVDIQILLQKSSYFHSFEKHWKIEKCSSKR